MHDATQPVIDSILQWMEKFVETPHPSFGNMPPCPYARQYRVQDKIKIVEAPTQTTCTHVWETAEQVFETWNDDFEAIIVARANVARQYNSAEAVSVQIKELNDKYRSKDLVALEDHPQDPEEIDGVQMNHGDLILVVIQRLSKINKHSEMLRNGEYYHKWSKENLDDVVNWRFTKDS
jgi:hypothetical protein